MPWDNPYWWASTQPARDQVAQDFDRTLGVSTPSHEVPFQKTAASACPKCGERQLNLIYDQTKHWNPRFQCAQCGYDHLIGGESRTIGTPYTQDEINQNWSDVVKSPNRDPMFLDPENWSNFGTPHQGSRTAMQWDADGNILPLYTLKPGERPYTTQDPRSPWMTHPLTSQRLTGAPGVSLMSHVMNTMGHPDVRSVWAQDYEVGKGPPNPPPEAGGPGILARVAGEPSGGMYHIAPSHLRDAIKHEGLKTPYRDGRVYMAETPSEKALAAEPNQLDVWHINTEGLPILPGDPAGWDLPEYTHAGDIHPSRLTLVHEGDSEWDRYQRGYPPMDYVNGEWQPRDPDQPEHLAKVARGEDPQVTDPVEAWVQQGQVLPYAKHDPATQKAIYQYMAVDGEAWDPDMTPEQYLAKYGQEPFGITHVPAQELLRGINAHPDHGPDWLKTFQEFSDRPDIRKMDELEGRGVPAESTEVWPVILDRDNGEVLEDGWHRAHHYMKHGVDPIPAVYYP